MLGSWKQARTKVEVKEKAAPPGSTSLRRRAPKQTPLDFAGRYVVLDVAVNPAVLRDSNVDVRALALRFAQKHCGLRVSQDYTVVGRSPNSSPDEISRRLGFRQKPVVREQPAEGIELNSLKMLPSDFPLLLFVWSPRITSDSLNRSAPQ